MATSHRQSGIGVVGDIEWGTHLCQFFNTKDDLIEILVPYFKAGLENNEFCMWVTSEPLQVDEAKASLAKAVKKLDDYINREQIEIIDYSQWYSRSGKLNSGEVLKDWVDKENKALDRGFDGLRLGGNISRLGKSDLAGFTEYETELDSIIGKHKIVAICTYFLDKLGVNEILNVAGNHEFVLFKQDGCWKTIISTGHSKSLEALRRTEKNFRTSLDDSPLGHRIVRPDGYVVYANKSFLEMHGCSSLEEFRKTPRNQRIATESYPYIMERKEKMLRGESIPNNFEMSITSKDGNIRYLQVWVKEVLWDGEICHHLIYQDITEPKRTRKALRESEEKYRTLVENATDLIFLIGEQDVILSVNKAAAHSLGKEPEEIELKKLFDIFPAELATRYSEHIRQVLSAGQNLLYEGNMIVDGKEFWITTSLNLVKDETGKAKAVLGVSRDITERKQSEKRLQFLSSIVEQVSDAVIVTDVDYRVTYVNKAAQDLFGYCADEIIGMKTDIFEAEPVAVYQDIHNTNLSGDFWSGTKLSKKKDGSTFINELKVSPIRDANGLISAYVGVQRDVTVRERRQLEHLKIAKLESLGILAGGIAHDFRNLLTGMNGNIQLAAGRIKEGKTDKASESLLEAEKASMRAKDLTQQLLTFSTGGAPVKKVTSIAQLIKDATDFALRGSKVKAEFSIPYDLWVVEVDEGQINQVISNIVINADQAMTKGGLIYLSAKNVVIGKEYALPVPDGNYLEILIKDDGIGIPKEYFSRIFDPYFTTKPKGMGLGLTTTFAIIRNHGGYLTVESELNVGTTFHIYLPASTKPVPYRPKYKATESLPQLHGTILVMDDQEIIRNLLKEVLEEIGYDVVLTEDGATAIGRYTESMKSGKTFDAVILDLTIPGGMGGEETIKRLLEIDPEVKAIVSSGYINDAILLDFKKSGFSAVLSKPYKLKDLQNTLHSMLNIKQ